MVKIIFFKANSIQTIMSFQILNDVTVCRLLDL